MKIRELQQKYKSYSKMSLIFEIAKIRKDTIDEIIRLVDDDLTYDIGMDLFVNRDLLCERLEELREQK